MGLKVSNAIGIIFFHIYSFIPGVQGRSILFERSQNLIGKQEFDVKFRDIKWMLRTVYSFS